MTFHVVLGMAAFKGIVTYVIYSNIYTHTYTRAYMLYISSVGFCFFSLSIVYLFIHRLAVADSWSSVFSVIKDLLMVGTPRWCFCW